MPWARGQGAPSVLSFNGLEYEWHSSTSDHESALDTAKYLREDGHKARVRKYWSVTQGSETSVYVLYQEEEL